MKKGVMEKLKIYISTYKDFISPVKSDVYQVIDSRKIHVNLPLDDKFYSEIYQYKWVCDNVELSDYVGFCHYRKYFSFLDNIPSMEGDKVIIIKPLDFGCSVKQQYRYCHNIEDLEIVENIIRERYKSYVPTMESYLNGRKFIWCNMFIMRKEMFKEYINFILNILNEYLKVVGTDINKRIEDNKEKYLKKFYPNNTVEYQYRIGGYLAERLTGIFLLHHFKNFEMYNMITTEKKY